MKDLSMHILDLVQNSIVANATDIIINISENSMEDFFSIEISDNGKGIKKEDINKVTDPFYTQRATRRVGLGLSLMKAEAQRCDGDLQVHSKQGEGTKVLATFKHSHIDRLPLGDMAETLMVIIAANPNIDIEYLYMVNNKKFELKTKEVKTQLQEIPINNTDVLQWLKDYINEGMLQLK